MIGESSSSVLATTTTAAGGGAAGDGNSPHQRQRQQQLPPGGGGANEISTAIEVGHVDSINSGDEEKGIKVGGGREDGDRSFGGNRWPRQETLALLKIRSDMDVAFRDASVKGPLWEEVSRKLAELGYNRNAKKCKEKFENVFKYHKRTKDGRTGKQEGKTYRFFDQLEAFENHPSSFSSPPPQPPSPPPSRSPLMPVVNPPPITVPSTTTAATAAIATIATQVPSFPPTNPIVSSSFPNFSSDILSTSSSTSSDVELKGRRRRKRKWRDFFERLMKEVLKKQEDMQRKFLEAIEKREHERMVREDSWRIQEMARINREREILAQERSIAAAKDATVMAFLQKLSDQNNPAPPPVPPPQPAAAPPPSQPVVTEISQPQPPTQPLQVVTVAQPQPAPPRLLPVVPVALTPPAPQPQAVMNLDTKSDNGDQILSPVSSSRWPKVEVEALIRLRTTLDSKYQENGPKGPLWEEISAGMRNLGYNRSSKRCKEKWENINKYFKKVKESNKKRPEDSKTCPYFHQLDALYKGKNKNDGSSSNTNTIQFKPENSVPLMVQPEQQWPPPPPLPPQQGRVDSIMEDLDSDENQDEDEDEEGGGYEIVANRSAASMSSTG